MNIKKYLFLALNINAITGTELDRCFSLLLTLRGVKWATKSSNDHPKMFLRLRGETCLKVLNKCYARNSSGSTEDVMQVTILLRERKELKLISKPLTQGQKSFVMRGHK